MKAAVIQTPGRISLEQVPDPVRAPEDVIIRVLHATICGSDLTMLAGGMDGVDYPLVPGHEWVGEVVEAGPAHRALRGRMVVSDLLESCGGCTNCLRNRSNLCAHLIEPGLTRPGAFAQFLAVRAANLFIVPDELPLAYAPLIEPLAVALYALRRVPIVAGETVAIIGGGGIGQLIARCCLAAGARAVLVDPHGARRAVAAAAGCTALTADGSLLTTWTEADLPAPEVVFEASGNPGALQTALELVAAAGRVGVVGYAGRRGAQVRSSLIMSKLLSVYGVLSPTGTWSEAIAHVRSGSISLHKLISHDFALDNIDRAFDCARARADGAIRVEVSP